MNYEEEGLRCPGIEGEGVEEDANLPVGAARPIFRQTPFALFSQIVSLPLRECSSERSDADSEFSERPFHE